MKRRILSSVLALIMMLSMLGTGLIASASVADDVVAEITDANFMTVLTIDDTITGLDADEVREMLGVSEAAWTVVKSTIILPAIATETLATLTAKLNKAIADELADLYSTSGTAQKIYTQAYETLNEGSTWNAVSQLVAGKSYQLRVSVRDIPTLTSLSIPLSFDETNITITSTEAGTDYPTVGGDWTSVYSSAAVGPIYGYQANLTDSDGSHLQNINDNGYLLLNMIAPVTSPTATTLTISTVQELFIVNFTVKDDATGVAGFAVEDYYEDEDTTLNTDKPGHTAHIFYSAGAYDATYPYYVGTSGMISTTTQYPITPYSVLALPIVEPPIVIDIFDEDLPISETQNPKVFYHNENISGGYTLTTIDFGANIDGERADNTDIVWSVSGTGTPGTISNLDDDTNGVFTPADGFAGDVVVRATSVADDRYYAEETIEVVVVEIPEIGTFSAPIPAGALTETFTPATATTPKIHTINWDLRQYDGALKLEGDVRGNDTTTDEGYTWEVWNGVDPVTDSDILNLDPLNDSNATSCDALFSPKAAGTYKVVLKSNRTGYAEIIDVMYITVRSAMVIEGRVIRTGKQRVPVSALWTATNILARTNEFGGFDQGVKVELIKNTEDAGSGLRMEQVMHTTYSNATPVVNLPALTEDLTANNYELEISQEILAEISETSYKSLAPGAVGTYFIRFSDVAAGVAGTNPTAGDGVRGASYMYTELDIVVEGALAAMNPKGNIIIEDSVYLIAGAFNSSSNYSNVTIVDANLIKSQIGVATSKVNEHFDINEYLGVDGADYATVVNFVGKLKSDNGCINLGDTDTTCGSLATAPTGGDIDTTVTISNPYN